MDDRIIVGFEACGSDGPSVARCEIVKDSMQQTFPTSPFSMAGAMVLGRCSFFNRLIAEEN